jgi:hypothetical protein
LLVHLGLADVLTIAEGEPFYRLASRFTVEAEA